MQSFDVVIAGGGMVGLALACGLQGSGLRVAVVENYPPDQSVVVGDVIAGEEYALRVSAINAASERLLQHLGVWRQILDIRTSLIKEWRFGSGIALVVFSSARLNMGWNILVISLKTELSVKHYGKRQRVYLM